MLGPRTWTLLACAAALLFLVGIGDGGAEPNDVESLPKLQSLIDEAEEGAILTPPPGTYAGPVVIDKPLTLDGQGQVTVDNGGVGTVVTIDTDGATVKNLRLVNSGESHNDIDAGVQIRGNFNVVKDNDIDDALFGIDLQQSNNNVVRRNSIRSKQFDLGVKGDAIRLWYSMSNKIEHNRIEGARDMVVWYSADNRIAHNDVRGGRYGLHFMYAQHNIVEDNTFIGNSVGAFLMYSDGIKLRRNKIRHGLGATGMGIGLKETSDVDIVDNEIVYCATGLYLDVSPFQPDTTNRIKRNRLSYNSIGILFHNDWTGNVLEDNLLEHNLVQVSVNAQASAKRNTWDGNFWDDYQGFDRDDDGTGDNPHHMKVYADRVWMDVPWASLFRGSPALSMIDFLERLAPFTEPIELLTDSKPKMTAVFTTEPADESGGDDPGEGEQATGRYDPFGLKDRLGKAR